MKSPLKVEARRCRPLLGTFVEIQARAGDEAPLDRGIDAAFGVIAKVHRLMSFHDPSSDVSRMNREAFPKGVKVHPWTWQIMKRAQEFARDSKGTFDLTVASRLSIWNFLPRGDYHLDSRANWRDICVCPNYEISFRRELIVDLGGIAKGFAVDLAIEALRKKGVVAGIVNAGGDVRVFGPHSQLIHLRHPSVPTRTMGAVKLCNRAMATSGIYFARRRHNGVFVNPLLDGRNRRCSRKALSVTVAAADCMTADALTKVVFALRQKAAHLLARHGADALIFEYDGSQSWKFMHHATPATGID